MISCMFSWALVLVAAAAILALPALLALHAIFGWRYRRAVECGTRGQGVPSLGAPGQSGKLTQAPVPFTCRAGFLTSAASSGVRGAK
jgi:hypothetical protein